MSPPATGAAKRLKDNTDPPTLVVQQDRSNERRWWTILTLVLVVVFCGIVFVRLLTVGNPSSSAIVLVLALTLGALVLTPRMFDISELNFGKSGVSAKIRQVEERIETVRSELLQKIAAEYDRVLHEQRLAAYRDLWTALEPLALYFPAKQVSYQSLLELGGALRHWYFASGMFLTSSGRDRYFFLQDILQTLCHEHDQQKLSELLPDSAQGPMTLAASDEQDKLIFDLLLEPAPPSWEEWKTKLYVYFTPKMIAKPEFLPNLRGNKKMHFRLVRCASSALRTQMADDLLTRRPSILQDLAH
jgi:hypothetical protein